MPAALAAASMSRSSRDPQRASPVSTPSLSFRSPHLGARHACWLSDASYRPWETQPVLHLLEAGGHGPWRGFLRHQWTEGWLSRDSQQLPPPGRMPGFLLYHIYLIPSPTHTWEAVLALSVWCLGPPRTTARAPVPRPLSSSSPAPGPLQAWANCSVPL